jgi:hypothetical protein
MNGIVKARCQHRRHATEPSVSQCEPQRVITAEPALALAWIVIACRMAWSIT